MSRQLVISQASQDILERGHPWVVRDRATGDTRGMKPGQLVGLRGPGGKPVGQALVDPSARVVARVLSRGERPLGPEVFALRARLGLRLRAALFDDPETDAFRCLHGEGDGLPGLFLDRFGDRLVVTLRCEAARVLLEPALEALSERWTPQAVYVREHFSDLRKKHGVRGTWRGSVPEANQWQVRELGCSYQISTDQQLGLGLYCDQRGNRERLRRLLRGYDSARVLNLFCYTGAFSVVAAKAGALVDSVDLSQQALDGLQANCALNGLDNDGCKVFAEDVRKFLKRKGRRYDVIVLDPPTFAKGKKGGFFAVSKELASLAGLCLGRLKPGGALLCSSNQSKLSRAELLKALGKEALRRRLQLQELVGPGPGSDFPQLPGFPEGDISKAVWCRAW